MPKSEREEVLAGLTSRIFSAMLEEIIMDATMQSHHEVARSRAVCPTCNTRCGMVHTPGSSSNAAAVASSRPGTPSLAEAKSLNGSAGTGTSTPTSTKNDGSLYLECVNCSRQIASNRYAPHLSSCMGLASARRGAARGGLKSKVPSDAGRSASPASEAGNVSESSHTVKGKAKSKVKRVDEAEFNLKRKRPVSPQVSPAKNTKKQKQSGSPVSRVKAVPAGIPRSNYSPSAASSHSKIPSKLRDSSTSFAERSPSPDSSRSSSPDMASVATPSSSSVSASPVLAARPVGNGKNTLNKVRGVGPPKRLSPPKPPPPIHVPDFTIDVDGGEETGSSTDTDSS